MRISIRFTPMPGILRCIDGIKQAARLKFPDEEGIELPVEIVSGQATFAIELPDGTIPAFMAGHIRVFEVIIQGETETACTSGRYGDARGMYGIVISTPDPRKKRLFVRGYELESAREFLRQIVQGEALPTSAYPR